MPMQEPYALQWTINNEPLDMTMVTKQLILYFVEFVGRFEEFPPKFKVPILKK